MIRSIYKQLFDIGCVKFGEYKLKSGLISPIYIDMRTLVSHPQLLKELGDMISHVCKELGCARIAGIPYAGLPLAVAAGLAWDIPVIYPRKEVKEYGTGRTIEGEFAPGDNILVVDDLITDGASKIEAIKPLVEAGMVVKHVLVILDREQGGEAVLAQAGYKLHALGRLSELLSALVIAGRITQETEDTVNTFIAANRVGQS